MAIIRLVAKILKNIDDIILDDFKNFNFNRNRDIQSIISIKEDLIDNKKELIDNKESEINFIENSKIKFFDKKILELKKVELEEEKKRLEKEEVELIELKKKELNENKKLLIRKIINYFIISGNDQLFIVYSSRSQNPLKSEYHFNVPVNIQIEVENFISRKRWNLHKAELLKSLLFSYVNLPSFKREFIMHYDNIIKLESIIKEKKLIKIKYKANEYFSKIEPLFIHTENERFNYLCAYSLYTETLVTYRISNISDIYIIDEKPIVDRENLGKYCLRSSEIKIVEDSGIDYYDKEKKISIKELQNNFDPFLSYLHLNIRVKLTENGKDTYKKRLIDKPKIIKNEEFLDYEGDDIFTLEASPLAIQILAGKLLYDMEILEPKYLRDEFRKIIEKTLKNYT